VTFEDERFTTAIAEREIAGGSLPLGKRREKGRVDAASAVAILETYLARTEAGA
jgi:RNase H-fold protein (predicted Holliday junction resolvase)